ncbi:MAG: HEPN domain-containing protein [Elusimicrobiota bacterium]|jgi:HEPN domain-containing protein|nr:HEPN domain-containing protein [Elusimicrobiota bacterium]
MTKEELINHWVNQADRDVDTMEYMFLGKRYDWSLFIGHLIIEKLLKALFIKVHGKDVPVPRIHNLVVLAERDKLILDNDLKAKLHAITAFNIEARYQDYKLAFYKRCAKQYAGKWKKEIEDLRKWLKSQI